MQPFRQDSNFAYLTGIHPPGFACAINSETGHMTLLAPKLDPQLVVWMGAQPSLDELAEEYGADSCAYLEDLDQIVTANFVDTDILALPKDKESLQQLISKHTADRYIGKQQQGDLGQALSASRAIKTDADVTCLQHASEISAQAHMAMWR